MLTESPGPAGVGGNDNRILGPGEGWILNASPEAPCHCLGVTRGLLAEKMMRHPYLIRIIFSYTSELHIYREYFYFIWI